MMYTGRPVLKKNLVFSVLASKMNRGEGLTLETSAAHQIPQAKKHTISKDLFLYENYNIHVSTIADQTGTILLIMIMMYLAEDLCSP